MKGAVNCIFGSICIKIHSFRLRGHNLHERLVPTRRWMTKTFPLLAANLYCIIVAWLMCEYIVWQMITVKQELERAEERIELVEYRSAERASEIEEGLDSYVTRVRQLCISSTEIVVFCKVVLVSCRK